MTIAISIKVNDGVVLAADSASTLLSKAQFLRGYRV
jgi:20S proteasome alpha/beta subunit